MPPVLLKIAYAVAVFAIAWLAGRLPRRTAGGASGPGWLGWGNAFAAGVFIGLGFVHLLAEAFVGWSELGWGAGTAPALAAAGFMALLFIEHVLLPQSAHSAVHSHSGEPLSSVASEPLRSRHVPWALLVGLSVHSLIAGVALGAERSGTGAWFIFLAILAHKWSAAFALGISLVRTEVPDRRYRRWLLLFATATPAGILLGTGGAELLRSTPALYFDATFAAITAGTFIYIGAADILQDELLQPGSRFLKWTTAAAAAAATAWLSSQV